MNNINNSYAQEVLSIGGLDLFIQRDKSKLVTTMIKSVGFAQWMVELLKLLKQASN